MSVECSECERDARGGHDESCSRHPFNVKLAALELRLQALERAFDDMEESASKRLVDLLREAQR